MIGSVFTLEINAWIPGYDHICITKGDGGGVLFDKWWRERSNIYKETNDKEFTIKSSSSGFEIKKNS